MTQGGRNAACPVCGEPLTWWNLAYSGVLRTRSSRDGGPYYTIDCPSCRSALQALVGAGRTYRFYCLRPERRPSRLGMLLRALFGKPAPRPQPAAEPGPRQRDGAAAGRARRAVKRAPDPLAESYAELGLAEEADLEAIKKRFRKLAKQCHPDLFARATRQEQLAAERRFIRLNRAYKALLARGEQESRRRE